MKKADRDPYEPRPQPLTSPGEQRPEFAREEDEMDATREWLRHVEAGHFG